MASSLISHIEIPTTDLDKSKDFFSKVFGWDFKPFGNGYLLFNNHKGIMVGLRKVDRIGKGENTVFHISVESIDDVLKNCVQHGGSIKRGKTIIPAMGWYALFFDIDGNSIGLYQRN
ncbi:MAG: VOC family protein [Ignavibacteriales bacterium]|nr:MAG: VOC family protein [Ignavibacteriales bacterium]